MAKIQNINKINWWQDVEQQEASCIAGGKAKGTDTLEGSLAVSQKAKQS